MELNVYDIIRGPWVTSKAYALNHTLKQLVLEVHPQCTKPQISEALKKLFNVDTKAVRVSLIKGKMRRAGRGYVAGKVRKKAMITLKEGQSIDFGPLLQGEGQV